MRKQKFVLAIIIGVIAIFVAMNLKPKQPAPKVATGTENQEEKVENIDAYVAKVNLRPGTKLNETNVKKKKFPEDKVPADAVLSEKAIAKKQTIALIKSGEFIIQSKLRDAEEIDRLTNIIPKGKRAMTIRVDEISGVGGFIRQGDRVDLVGIFGNVKDLPFNEPVKTILVGVKILSIGYEMETGETIDPESNSGPKPKPKPGEGMTNVVKAKKVPLVTIAVTLEEAEILTLVADKARFRLLLRSSKDTDSATAEIELEEERKKMNILTKELAKKINTGKNTSSKFAPPSRGGKNNFGFDPAMLNDPNFDPSNLGKSGLFNKRPTQINNVKAAVKKVIEKKPLEYRVETRKGTQPPATVTVKD